MSQPEYNKSYVQTNQIIQLPDANANISDADTGKIFLIPALGGVRSYNLPTRKAGLHYTFIKQGDPAAGNTASVVGPGAGFIRGVVLRGDASVDVAIGTDIKITFGATSESGDRIDLYCDGVNWSISGFSSAAVGILFSA